MDHEEIFIISLQKKVASGVEEGLKKTGEGREVREKKKIRRIDWRDVIRKEKA